MFDHDQRPVVGTQLGGDDAADPAIAHENGVLAALRLDGCFRFGGDLFSWRGDEREDERIEEDRNDRAREDQITSFRRQNAKAGAE
jgi:hypothetical protein